MKPHYLSQLLLLFSILILSAVGALAQPGQDIPTAIDLGVTEAPIQVAGRVDTSHLNNWYRFEVRETVRAVTVKFTGTPGNAYVSLLRSINPAAPEAVAGQMFGGAGSFKPWLNPGSYFVQVSHQGYNIDYQLTIESEAKPSSPGAGDGTHFTATDLGATGTAGPVEDFVGVGDKEDWYRFQIAGSVRAVTVEVAGTTGNVYLSLHRDKDQNGQPEDLAGKHLAGRGVVWSWLDAGTYYVKVAHDGYNTTYRIGLSSEVRPQSAGEGNQDAATASPLPRSTVNGLIHDFVGLSDTVDWYSFEVKVASRTVKAEVAGTDGNVYLSLLRDAGPGKPAEEIASRLFEVLPFVPTKKGGFLTSKFRERESRRNNPLGLSPSRFLGHLSYTAAGG